MTNSPLSTADLATLAALRAEIRRQVLEVFLDFDANHWASGMLDVAAVAMRSDAWLNDLALVADQFLAWDSQSFVNECGVRSRDIRADDVTSAGYAKLQRLNGGAPFTYSLSYW